MTSRATSLVGKKALVLSDNDTLSRVVELNLNKLLGMQVVKLAPSTLEEQGIPAQNNNFDLIVVAISSPTGELIVSLIRAQLAERIRDVPLLSSPTDCSALTRKRGYFTWIFRFAQTGSTIRSGRF